MKHTEGKVIAENGFLYAFDKNKCTIIAEEAEANAELIAEAFNVTNECGLTPRQLLEQRNELLNALKDIMISVELLLPPKTRNSSTKYTNAQTAINNAQNK